MELAHQELLLSLHQYVQVFRPVAHFSGLVRSLLQDIGLGFLNLMQIGFKHSKIYKSKFS